MMDGFLVAAGLDFQCMWWMLVAFNILTQECANDVVEYVSSALVCLRCFISGKRFLCAVPLRWRVMGKVCGKRAPSPFCRKPAVKFARREEILTLHNLSN